MKGPEPCSKFPVQNGLKFLGNRNKVIQQLLPLFGQRQLQQPPVLIVNVLGQKTICLQPGRRTADLGFFKTGPLLDIPD